MADKRATMDDVGKLAGVSRQTVSRVLNHHPLVSAGAERRVRKAMEILSYHPDPVARSLATRRTYLIAVLTTSFTRYVPALTLDGAEQSFREEGYQIFVTRCGGISPGAELSAPLVRNQPLEGALIVLHGFKGQSAALLDDLPSGVPVVTTGYAAGHPRIVSFTVANRSGGRMAADRLLALGRRRLAMITGPEADLDALDRSEGFFAALRGIGISREACVTRVGDWSYERGYAAMREILARGGQIDGVFAQNDPTAVGAVRAVHEAGRRVPDDIAVIGFDDIPLASYVEPALTTIQIPAFDLGRVAARALIRLISGVSPAEVRDAADISCLEPSLVVRESG